MTSARLLKARAELREWLGDLAMLAARVDVVDKGRKAFNDAWVAALAGAQKAAVEYADAAEEALSNNSP